MTIDEAIQILNLYDLGNMFLDIDGNPIGYEKMSSACDMAVEALNALKQEPCEDTISRQAAIDSLNEYFARIGKLKRRGLNEGEKAISLDTIGVIKTLPTVTPHPKIGKWVSHYDYCKKHELLPSGLISFWWCDLCEQGVEHKTNFCPRCGAKMVDIQESGDDE